MLFGGVLVDGSSRQSSVATRDLASLVDEVLEQIALILGQEKELGLLNDLAEVGDQVPALLGQLGRGLGESIRGNG